MSTPPTTPRPSRPQFIVRAYQMGSNWGWVGPMFLWNLNFAPVSGQRDEKAAFGIVRADWGPRPAYSRAARHGQVAQRHLAISETGSAGSRLEAFCRSPVRSTGNLRGLGDVVEASC